MNNNGFGSSPIRTYKKQNQPNGLRTALILLMTVVIIAAVVIFIMSLTGTGMFADKKGGNTPAQSTEESSSELTPPESSTPEQSSTDPAPVDPNGIKYTFIRKNSAMIGKGDLLLINEDHLYKFTEGDLLEDLYPVPNAVYSLRNVSLQLKTGTVAQLNKMMQAAVNETGFKYFSVWTAFRSFDEQVALKEKNPTGASSPGASDYHSGSTFEIIGYDSTEGKSVSLKNTEGAKWLKQHAYEYGFVFRSAGKGDIVGYDIDWQLRYVGIPHSEYMFINNLCLEEYLTKLTTDHRFSADGSTHLTVECIDGNTYQVYYVDGTTEENVDINVPVPSNRRYTISGDNVQGFIVTVLVEEAQG